MAIRIGHASIDENGKITGGTSGDQNGKEVCIRNWYNNGWEFLARPKSAAVAEKMALACEAGCANGNIGYDQGQRNTLNTQAKKVDYDLSKILTPCETDCSAFVSVCVLAAGVKLDYSGNLPTTRTLKSVLNKSGAFDIYTDSKYLTGTDYLRRGDILCKSGKHTVMVLDSGPNGAVVAAEWTWPILKKGSKGASVKALQILLMGYGYSCGSWGADGDFGAATESALKAYQSKGNLTVNGQTHEETWMRLLGIG